MGGGKKVKIKAEISELENRNAMKLASIFKN